MKGLRVILSINPWDVPSDIFHCVGRRVRISCILVYGSQSELACDSVVLRHIARTAVTQVELLQIRLEGDGQQIVM